jgi:hypothetical protein
MTSGVAVVYVEDSSDKTITGAWYFDRDNGGVFGIPSGTSFPTSPEADEFFLRSDTMTLYKRDTANAAWDAVVATPASHTHPGSDITSQVADSDKVDGHDASDFALVAHTHAHGDLTSVTANQHHAQVHAIDGPDHTGSLGHSSLSGVTATQHHSNANDPTSDEKAALDNAPNALTASNPVTDKSYVDSKTSGTSWLAAVKDRMTSPPSSPSSGDRYLIDGTGTGAWSGHDGEIAEWNGSSWTFTVPSDGSTVTVQDEDTPYTQTEASSPWVWVASGGSTAIHGNEKHNPDMLTVGSNRSDTNLDILTDGDEDDDVDPLHLHIRRDKSKFYLWDDFGGYRLNTRTWHTSVGGSGSNVATLGGSHAGGQLRIRSGDASGRSADLDWNGRYQISAPLGFEFASRLMVVNLSNSYFEIGTAYYGSGDSYISFTRSGAGNWMALCQSDGSQTDVDTGVSSDTSWHVFKIVASSSSVRFYIDGSLVATITSNISTRLLQCAAYQETTGGSSNRSTYIDYIEIVGGRES